MAITAAMVKELRTRTGAGMMECKGALIEADGDLDAAAELLRKKGAAQADKKSGRIAAEGIVVALVSDDAKLGALVEVNCETDFVAKDVPFSDFAKALAYTVLKERPQSVEALNGLSMSGGTATVDETRRELISKIGENIQVRRFHVLEARGEEGISAYVHGTRIGVLVNLRGGRPELGKDLAMHVAASRPMCISNDEVPEQLVAKEREIYAAQAAESGKPENIIDKIVEGRLHKYYKEVTLLGQAFVKDPERSVGKLLESEKAVVLEFVRYEVGEGLERRTDDFASDVMAQAKGV